MKQITLRELKRYLNDRSQTELINDIAELFNRLDAVKDFYSFRLVGGYDEQLVETHKQRIKNEFFPTRGFGSAKLSVARKAITDYKKVASSAEGVVELMVFYVEMGVRFTNEYGDIDEAFYNSMESMYEQAAKLIVKHEMQDKFESRCRKIVSDTSGIGWGFHDELSELYAEYFYEYTS
jgi:hypothetical protein